MKKNKRRRADVILLKDLAPRQDVKGGAGKRLFGERLEPNERSQATGPGKTTPEQTRTRRKDQGKPG